MFVHESIDGVLKGKSQEQIDSDFMAEYGIPFTEMDETLESLKKLGVTAKISNLQAPDKNYYKVIEMTTWDISRSQNESTWNSVGSSPIKEIAEKIVDYIKDRLDIHSTAPYVYKILPNNWHNYLSNIDALKLLSKLTKLNES